MTAPTPVGYLDFFILEGSDYVEHLDALLLAAGERGPDVDALQRVARALRGSATMAKLLSIAEMAAGIERVGRGLRDGTLTWEPGLRGVVVATVDDFKVLLRTVRTWGDDDERRARARIGELAGYAAVRGPTPVATPSMQGHDSYLANETSNIGAGLELLVTRPTDRDAAVNVLRRVRALRGIASVKDHDALADVLEAAERAAHPLELGEPTLSAERIALLEAAATVLRGVAAAMRAGGSSGAAPGDVARFAAALDAVQEQETGADRVVPISELFYDDGGQTIVDTAPNPPTTPAERFRLEAVSQGEHLRRVISDARGAHDDLARERVRRGLRQVLRALRQSAESFEEKDVADFVASRYDAATQLEAGALHSLDEFAALLTRPDAVSPAASARISGESARAASMTPIMPAPAIAEPSPAPQERVQPAVAELVDVAAQVRSPAQRLDALLGAGIATLGALDRAPFIAPAPIAEQPPVPIGVLLYRGRSAIERCREIRDDVRRTGGTVDASALSELFDLLDLALTP